jgi:hypothetical protein
MPRLRDRDPRYRNTWKCSVFAGCGLLHTVFKAILPKYEGNFRQNMRKIMTLTIQFTQAVIFCFYAVKRDFDQYDLLNNGQPVASRPEHFLLVAFFDRSVDCVHAFS